MDAFDFFVQMGLMGQPLLVFPCCALSIKVFDTSRKLSLNESISLLDNETLKEKDLVIIALGN